MVTALESAIPAVFTVFVIGSIGPPSDGAMHPSRVRSLYVQSRETTTDLV